jgi:hypothetical protein
MQGNLYRLKTPTLGVVSEDGQRKPFVVPVGAVVTVISGPLDNDPFVDIVWEGKTVMMFTRDIRERGEAVAAAVQ